MAKADILKAKLPRGFADRPPADLAATHRMLDAIRETYELYGFEGIETPFVEYTEALGKFLPDQDRPNEGVFSFQDDDEQWLSLRYDLTAPLARHVAERLDAQALTLPYRSYRSGWVFRNEKPGPGRFRQFMQFDADTVGSSSPAADAEMCMMMADTLEKVGIPRGSYVVKVNNRKVLDGVMEAIGLGGAENAGRRMIVLRAVDKLDRLGPDSVAALLGLGRRDESGDFTKGAGLSREQIERVTGYLGTAYREGRADLVSAAATSPVDPFGEGTFRSSSLSFSAWRSSVSGSLRGAEGIDELEKISELLVASGYDVDRVMVDASVVRGLEYYTGTVFEAELTVPITDAEGRAVRLGSLAGGGRYDGLVGRFRSEPVPATGFSIGVSRLQEALAYVRSTGAPSEPPRGPVVVLVMDRDRMAEYQAMVSRLRAAEIAAELYLGVAGMKAQMRYADRRRAPCVVIQGSQERERGEVQIKDLVLGTDRATQDAAASSNAEYRAARIAQVSVRQDDLVDEVGKMLARHRAT